MHSFEVHSNESACRKSGRLGMEQVFGARLELHSLASLLLEKISGLLVRPLARFVLVDHQEFIVFPIMYGSMQHACFIYGRRIARMVCMFSLSPSGATLLEV